MSEKVLNVVVKVVVGGVLLLFYVMGVFGKPTPGIDKEILADHLHPFTVLDFIGTVLFTACGLFIGGFAKMLGFDPAIKGSGLNIAAFGVGILGAVLMVL